MGQDREQRRKYQKFLASNVFHRFLFKKKEEKSDASLSPSPFSLLTSHFSKGHSMNKIVSLTLAAAMLFGGAAQANKINRVIPVNFITIEVVMEEPLSAAETDPFGWEAANRFDFGGQIQMTGAPMEVEMKGYPNTYHIPVAGMDIGIIYKISYDGGKAKTFRVYEEQEMTEKYKNRYGDYF